ncbi:hypothetical protein HRI_004059700 [Hibiscus trionum]|uniref:Wound-responsive family protein n=1 Tax=Hibiscus trionum TaxID=183268 RepID=A0A9W7IWJ0_HIBTR|nr:hypothetical protein HRI_004059700 [Hibiscus trionum]
MEEGDKSIDVGEETSTRVSDGSPSWLFAKRQRFTIELRPGETTIVSWKRLVKDAHNISPPLSARNTEDSLDAGFQDDKSTSKQNGLSVSSDKLECTNETVLSVAQPSRKRRKNMAEARVEKVDDLVPSKHAKVEQGRLNFAATNAVLEEQSSALLQNSAAAGEPDRRFHDLFNSVRSTSKLANIGTKSEHSSYTEVSNKDASISASNSKDADKYRSVTIHSSDLGNNTNSLVTHRKHLEKRSCKKHKSPLRKLMTENGKEEISTEVEKTKKRATCGELPDLNLPVYPVQSESKDVSNLRPKGTMLDKAMRELEKVVAESRLSTMEVQDIDASSAAIKRRLPCEVKQKLAKVARLAHSSQGKISKELINKLMNILGHSVQLRTLKRNLKEMILMELSAKQEKVDRFQQIKSEVTEMIKLQLGDVATGDVQEVLGSEEKVVLKKQDRLDNIMEDKICDLYDLYIQGLDEDKGPQIRKLYVELAKLWPNGIIDKHGIKSAICRAKERKRKSCENDKVREVGRKKSAQKMEVGVEGEARSVFRLQAVQENQEPASSSHILALPPRTTSCKVTLDQHLAAPLEIASVPPNSGFDISEEKKIAKMTIPSLKEKMKQKGKSKNRVKKLSMKPEKESRKSHKKAIGHPDAASYKLAAPSSCVHPH